ncbi:hypothetical protein [Streptomyces europaeiscabiei]|uniref:hypothetical protein n=1 Tax=Streptomyces europaeiscabiei TaxID=146819 RepID=UPI002E194A80
MPGDVGVDAQDAGEDRGTAMTVSSRSPRAARRARRPRTIASTVACCGQMDHPGDQLQMSRPSQVGTSL